MKVLLVNPPIRDFYDTPQRRLPLGLAYLAASLGQRAHTVHLIDARRSSEKTRCAPPAQIAGSELDSYALDTSPFAFFGRWRHFGLGFSEIEALARDAAPDVVGISSLFSPYAAEAEQTAAAVRRALPGVPVVMGGGHPSAFPSQVVAHRAVDFAIVGEGERAFADLVDALASKRAFEDLPGLAFPKEGRVHVNPPIFEEKIDEIALPARDLFDEGIRERGRSVSTQIVSSRGCPMKCTFCSAHLTAGRIFRPRDPELVVAEMKLCADRYGVTHFDFEDDNLTLDRQRALTLARSITRTFGARTLSLEAFNGFATRGLDEELLQALHEAGIGTLHLAPLSSDALSIATMNRESGMEDFVRVARSAVQTGLSVTAYLMVGYPGQTVREIMTTLNLLLSEQVRVTPSIFYPAAGSAVQKELMPHLDSADSAEWALTRSSCFPTVPGGLSRSMLRTLYWMIRLGEFGADLARGKGIEEIERLCAQTAARRAPDAPHPPGQPWSVKSPERLDRTARGLEALGAYMRTAHPHGIRLIQRGRNGRPWKYSIYPLPGLIEDRSFYRRWGVPGF